MCFNPCAPLPLQSVSLWGCYVCLSSSIPVFCAKLFFLCVFFIFIFYLSDLRFCHYPFGFVSLFCLMSGFTWHDLYLCLRHSLPLSRCGVCFHYERSRQINIVSPCDHFGSLRSHLIVFPVHTQSLVQRPLACTKTAHSVIHLWYKQSNTYHCLTLQEWPIRFQLYASL